MAERVKKFINQKSVGVAFEKREVDEIDRVCEILQIKRGDLIRDVVIRYLKEMDL